MEAGEGSDEGKSQTRFLWTSKFWEKGLLLECGLPHSSSFKGEEICQSVRFNRGVDAARRLTGFVRV